MLVPFLCGLVGGAVAFVVLIAAAILWAMADDGTIREMFSYRK